MIETMCNIIFFGHVMPCCWFQCHMMPTVSSVAPFNLLGQDDQKEMQNDFFGSCDATGISIM